MAQPPQLPKGWAYAGMSGGVHYATFTAAQDVPPVAAPIGGGVHTNGSSGGGWSFVWRFVVVLILLAAFSAAGAGGMHCATADRSTSAPTPPWATGRTEPATPPAASTPRNPYRELHQRWLDELREWKNGQRAAKDTTLLGLGPEGVLALEKAREEWDGRSK